MGPGFRESLKIVTEGLSLDVLQFATSEQVLDWRVPKEWIPEDAYIITPEGKKIADFKNNNLHLLNYSVPFQGKISLSELKTHLFSIPEMPDAIPYLTSYYSERWGFCLSHRELESLKDGVYEVVVQTKLVPGHLDVGELYIAGKSNREILFSTYLCHPSLANNELSGPLCMRLIYDRLKKKNLHYSYRFVFSAETIGTIAYLSRRGEELKKNIMAGYQVTCVGDRGPFTYKKTRGGNALADRAALEALKTDRDVRVVAYDPADGSDERQYCSPGFDLPVGSLMRTMYAQYPEYHTSLDDRSFIDFDKLLDSVAMYEKIVEIIEGYEVFENLISKGWPQLGPRGLYPSLGAQRQIQDQVRCLMWLLNFSDGKHELSEISRLSGHSYEDLHHMAEECCRKGVLQKL